MVFYKKVALLCALIMCSTNPMSFLNWRGKSTHTQTSGFQISPEQRKRIENEIKKVDLELLINKGFAAITLVGLAAATVGLVIYGHGLCAKGFAPDVVPKEGDLTTPDPNYQYLYSTLLTGSVVALSIPALHGMHEEMKVLEKHRAYLKRSLPAQPSK